MTQPRPPYSEIEDLVAKIMSWQGFYEGERVRLVQELGRVSLEL